MKYRKYSRYVTAETICDYSVNCHDSLLKAERIKNDMLRKRECTGGSPQGGQQLWAWRRNKISTTVFKQRNTAYLWARIYSQPHRESEMLIYLWKKHYFWLVNGWKISCFELHCVFNLYSWLSNSSNIWVHIIYQVLF